MIRHHLYAISTNIPASDSLCQLLGKFLPGNVSMFQCCLAPGSFSTWVQDQLCSCGHSLHAHCLVSAWGCKGWGHRQTPAFLRGSCWGHEREMQPTRAHHECWWPLECYCHKGARGPGNSYLNLTGINYARGVLPLGENCSHSSPVKTEFASCGGTDFKHHRNMQMTQSKTVTYL